MMPIQVQARVRVSRNVIPVRSICPYECLQVQALRQNALDADGFRQDDNAGC